MEKNKYKKTNPLDIAYTIVDFARFILIVIVVVFLVLTFVMRKEQVSGTSMYPTLKDGESVIINVAANYIGELKRFDVVVAKEYQSNDLWVKRIIGLPGETISYKEDKLYINGEYVEEPFLDKNYMEEYLKKTGKRLFTEDYTSKKLGEDEYLLVGDNRGESLDSRSETVGPFKREQIIAEGMLVYKPLSDARYVSNGTAE